MRKALRDRTDDFDIGRLGESRELFERILDGPRISGTVDPDQERVFFRLMGIGE